MSGANETPGITYQASLPLNWRWERAPSAPTLTAARHTNIALLRALATLEAAPPELDREADSHLAKALERLETKVDIALSMLARLAQRDIDMPAVHPVTLGARTVEWHSDSPMPAENELVLISLFLSPRLPEPLTLFARVVACAPGSCTAEMLDDDEEFVEWLVRTLFRYHRRGLQARHQE